MKIKDKCLLWIQAAKTEHISDDTFDVLSYQLAKAYPKLPKWFRDKIPLENLQIGSTFDMDITKL